MVLPFGSTFGARPSHLVGTKTFPMYLAGPRHTRLKVYFAMNSDSLRRPLVTLGLVLALIGSSLPFGAGEALAAARTQLGAVAYDHQSDQLVIPVSGVAPRVRIQQLSARQFIADLPGCHLRSGGSRSQRAQHSALAGWSAANEPVGRGVRLRLTVRDEVRPDVRFDAVHHRLLVTFNRAPGSLALLPRKPVRPAATTVPILPLRPVRPMAIPKKPLFSVAVNNAALPGRVEAVRAIETQLPARPVPVSPLVLLASQDGPGCDSTSLSTVPQSETFPARPSVVEGENRAELVTNAIASRRLLVRPLPTKPLVLLSAANPKVAAARISPPQRPTVRKKTPQSHVARRAVVKTARLGLPRFDQKAGHLVVPLTSGSIAAKDISRVKLNKRWSYIDIEGAMPYFAGVRYEERPDFVFQRWVMARRPGKQATRVSFASGVHVELDVKVTPRALLVAVVPTETVLSQKPPTPAVAPETQQEKDFRDAFYAAVAPLPPGSEETVREPAPAPAKLEVKIADPIKRNPAPAGVIETRVRRPFYDEERFGLAIPYEGRTPLFRYASKSEESAIIELKADVLSSAHLQEDLRRNLKWGSWKLNRKGRPGVLTLEMNFARPSEVSIAADPERRQLLIIPQPKLSRVAVAEVSAVRSSLSPVQLDKSGEHLFIPFKGSVPRYVLEQVTPTFAYVVFEASALRDAGVQFQTPSEHPRLNYTLVTQPEGTSTVRLAVCMARPATAAVFQDPNNTRLVVSLGKEPPVALSNGPKVLQVPQPWPGALRETPSIPTSALQNNS